MDQLKEFLRQAIKYRFWIVVGVAAILPLIAYFVATGPIKAATDKGAGEIKSAANGVKDYVSGTFPNPDYKSLLEERTGVLTKDVKDAWRMLYNQQAPLLTWPPEVENEFKAWGITKWPKDAAGNDVDDTLVEQTINAYVQVYPQYVEKVYKSFKPFNYEDGTGIVAAPPQEELLRPATFSPAKPPTYGKIVAAQQKLWIQGTVLDVVDKVNGTASSWDKAPIKQVMALEVANSKAQDQRSVAKGETLELAPEIVKPGTESTTTTAASSSSGGSSSSSGSDAAMSAYYASSSSSGGRNSAPEEVYFLAAKSPDQPYRIAPVYVAVLIDQNRMLEVFEKFKLSPMAIQVVDFELKRPATRIKKPVKGEAMFSPYMGMGGSSGGESVLGGQALMAAYYRTMQQQSPGGGSEPTAADVRILRDGGPGHGSAGRREEGRGRAHEVARGQQKEGSVQEGRGNQERGNDGLRPLLQYHRAARLRPGPLLQPAARRGGRGDARPQPRRGNAQGRGTSQGRNAQGRNAQGRGTSQGRNAQGRGASQGRNAQGRGASQGRNAQGRGAQTGAGQAPRGVRH